MNRTQSLAFATILGVSACLSLAYNILQPIWEAPDEPAHFGYVRFIQASRTLPRASADLHAFTQPWNTTSEYSQAPLYYVTLAIALLPLRLPANAEPHLNPFVAWPGHPWREAVALHRSDEGWPYQGLARFVHAGRLASTVFGLMALIATFGLLLTIGRDPNLALFGMAWLAFAPVYLLTSSRLGNDSGSMAAGAVTLFLCGRLLTRRMPLGVVALVSASLSLTAALITKLDTMFLVPLVLAAVILAAAPGVALTRRIGRRLGMATGALALPVGAFIGWWITYGQSSRSVVGIKAGFGVLDVMAVLKGVDGHALLAAFWNWNATWWGGVGWGTLTLWPSPVYIAMALPLVFLVGAGLMALARSRFWGEHSPNRLTALLLAVSTVPIFYATFARAAVPEIGLDSNARFTLPAAPVVALLVALGGRNLPLGRFRRALVVAYLGSILVLDLATAVVLLPAIPVPAIPARLAAQSSNPANPPVVRFANGVDLLTVDGVPSVLRPGSEVTLGLTWAVRSAPERDFIAFIQVLDSSSQRKVASLDAVPLERTFPPRLWQVDEIVEERRSFTLPPVLAPGRYILLVGAYYLGPEGIAPLEARSSTTSASSITLGEWSVQPDAVAMLRSLRVGVTFGSAIR